MPGCTGRVVAHGLCPTHYQQRRRTGSPDVTRPPSRDLDLKLTIRLSEREMGRLRAKAAALGQPVSAVLRAALDKFT